MKTAHEIRSWLLQRPRASSLRVTDTEGATHQITCQGIPWARIAETVAAIRPDLIEALGENGALLRATRCDDEPEDNDDQERTHYQPGSSSSSSGGGLTLEALRPFAEMLSDAYRHTNTVAFDKLVQLYEASNDRLTALERTRQREMELREKELSKRERELDKDEGDGEASGGDLLTDMATSFVAASMQGQGSAPAQAAAASPPTNGKPNGHHRSNGRKP